MQLVLPFRLEFIPKKKENRQKEYLHWINFIYTIILSNIVDIVL